MKKFGWVVFVFFAIGVGIFPVVYLITDAKIGLLNSKTDELLQSQVWRWAFYQHITLGGIALLTGWSQFSKKIRTKRLNLHRTLGKIYVSVCFLSGVAASYLAYHATGGLPAKIGFGFLAAGWLSSTAIAYVAIRNRNIDKHQAWMIRSYAFTFAAVTLRIWLPLSQVAQIDFIEAYRVIAWLCWVPNILLAEWILFRMRLPGVLSGLSTSKA